MSFHQHDHVYPGIAGSAIGMFLLAQQQAGVDNAFIPCGSTLAVPFGLTIATSPSVGGECAVVWSGVAKGIAGTAVAAGDLVGHATNGKLGPLTPGGVASVPVVARWSIGRAMESAVAGETFAVALERSQIF